MSIDFLCGREEQQQQQQQQQSSSPLNLLCDAVLDAEYSKGTKALTVLVGPDRKDTSAVSISMYYQESSPLSDDMSSDTKADSAVGMSPHSHEGHWKDEDNDDDDFDVDGLSDLLNDQSDLSSIGSADWSDHEQDSEDISDKPKSKATSAPETLTCIACKRELRRDEISEQVGCDSSITADLVTWTWTPSALFTDWRPKRCPRCERHFTIFSQEWPNRKIKKKKKKQQQPMVADTQHNKLKKTKKPRKTPTPKLKIDTDLCSNDDLFSPLTPLSDYCGDEQDLFNIPF